MRSVPAALALASVLLDLACSPGADITVPFVGCPSDGQVGYIAAPKGSARAVPLDRATALQFAYYKGGNARGVFAPRGWHCQIWYGSSGSHVLVSPATIDSGNFEALHLLGSAVELGILDGRTSGRFGVARYASRLFPGVAAGFIDRVRGEGVAPASAFDLGPYPNDSIRYADSLSLEFITPAMAEGLGTDGDLAPSHEAVRGIVILDPVNDWSLLLLRVRVGGELDHLVATIIELNRECIRDEHC